MLDSVLCQSPLSECYSLVCLRVGSEERPCTNTDGAARAVLEKSTMMLLTSTKVVFLLSTAVLAVFVQIPQTSTLHVQLGVIIQDQIRILMIVLVCGLLYTLLLLIQVRL